MSVSTLEASVPEAETVTISGDTLTAELSDGRTISVPLDWYPRLTHATPEERDNWRLIGGGEGIHWPDLDEDISAEGLIAGRPSAESQESLQRWLEAKRADCPLTLDALLATTAISGRARSDQAESWSRSRFPRCNPRPSRPRSLRRRHDAAVRRQRDPTSASSGECLR